MALVFYFHFGCVEIVPLFISVVFFLLCLSHAVHVGYVIDTPPCPWFQLHSKYTHLIDAGSFVLYTGLAAVGRLSNVIYVSAEQVLLCIDSE